jgi:hypothetical protein
MKIAQPFKAGLAIHTEKQKPALAGDRFGVQSFVTAFQQAMTFIA